MSRHSLTVSMAAEFASGAVFAIGLYSSGVYDPSIIRAQMDFTSNVMLVTMMGANAASAIVMEVLDRFGVMERNPRGASDLGFFAYDGNILGGFLLGVGMAVTGACPGTSLVQVGAGMANGAFVVLGGLLGAVTFVKLQEAFKQTRHDAEQCQGTGSKPPLDVAAALGVRPLTVLLVWVPLSLGVMRLAFEKDQTVREITETGLVPPAYGGLLIGVAQLATTLLTGHAIGASAAYEDLVRWIESAIPSTSPKSQPKPALLTPSVVFSAGAICSAALLNQCTGQKPTNIRSAIDPMTATQGIVGGWAMLLGARIAGGCTSGHGISGMAKLSLASLVTTASLFGAGIATTGILRQ